MTNRLHPVSLLDKYYRDLPLAKQTIIDHSRRVTGRAVRIARRLQKHEAVDIRFIAEAAMLHDIGSLSTDAPEMGCFGDLPYLCHGFKGAEILISEGLPRHALVCERHTGVGLSAAEILAQKLPLPARDMFPVSLEEQIICYADLFYSKSQDRRDKESSIERVRKKLRRFGHEKVAVFDQWLKRFEPEYF